MSVYGWFTDLAIGKRNSKIKNFFTLKKRYSKFITDAHSQLFASFAISSEEANRRQKTLDEKIVVFDLIKTTFIYIM